MTFLPLAKNVARIFGIIDCADTIGITLDVGVNDRPAVIGRTVVKNQDINKRICLRKNTVEALGQIASVVEIGNNGRDPNSALGAGI
ncbi:hypothetical protein D3C87_1352440 [compost metagenome]